MVEEHSKMSWAFIVLFASIETELNETNYINAAIK